MIMKKKKRAGMTTGQVSGITWLAPTTMYRYVKDYPDYFSDPAKLHTKGRRWNDQDIETLNAIRTLHHSRLGKEKIKEALSNGWRPPIDSEPDREKFNRALESVFALRDEIDKMFSSHETRHQYLSDTLSFEIKNLYSEIADLKLRLQQIEDRPSLFKKWNKSQEDKL